MLQDYLTNKKQITKLGIFYSSWETILPGVPLGSILFTLFMYEMFLTLRTTYLTGNAGDTTPLVLRGNTVDVIDSSALLA